MQTLSFGVFKPDPSDTGDVFFPAMAANCDYLNNHTHDGFTGQPVASTPQTIAAASWLAAPIGGGVYYQTVAIPGAYTFDGSDFWFRLSTGQVIYPSIERVDNFSYNIFINDNTLAVIANYR
jgi:hypothetical protein